MSKSEQAKVIVERARKAAIEGVEKAKQAAKDNPDKIHKGLDKVGDTINQATKGKYADKVDNAKKKTEKVIQDQAHKPSPGTRKTTPGDVATPPSPDYPGGNL